MTNSPNWVMQLPPEKLQTIAARLRGKRSAAIPVQEQATGDFPLSFAQERLWFLDRLEPNTAFYNIPGSARMRGPLLVPALQASLGALVARHASLRTTFGDLEGRPYQRVVPTLAVAMPMIDLAGLPAARIEPELERLGTDEVRRPFDLTGGPLLRVQLFRLGAADHAVVYTLHHIVSDGWSSRIFLRDIGAFYDAFAWGREPELPPLPIQFHDYAVWQRGHLQGEMLDKHLDFWRRQLAGNRGLELPTDRPRPAVEAFRGHARTVALSPTLSEGLNELARAEGASLFMLLLGVFDLLLYRYTGQTDVPVGSPIANRNRKEVDGLIGFFANTLVLRADLAGNPTFRALLARVKEMTLATYAHEDLPFERVVEAIQPERDMSRNPLFQVMCVLQNQPRRAMPAGELSLDSFHLDMGAAKFDFTVFWFEEGNRIAGLVEHNTDLFDDATALRIYTHYEALLSEVVADPDRPLAALPLLAASERHQLVAEWNDTAARAPAAPGLSGLALHRQVEEQARQIPEETALVFAGRPYSYREVNERANRLARGLAGRGVGPESRVGICLARSAQMVIAALAVLKAGGALVALDPAYPRERLSRIVEDADLAVLLTDEAMLDLFPERAGITLVLEPGREPFPSASGEDLEVEVTPEHPMYVIYTSGSTGQPKGIVVPHRAFGNFLAWQMEASPLAGTTRTVQFATFGFCVSFQEIFSAFCSGGALVVADEMTRRDVESLGELLRDERIERLHLPYAALKHLADVASGDAADLGATRLPSTLREVITAGEQLRVTPAVTALFDRLPGCTLHNQYGASETHVVSALTLAGTPGSWPSIPSVGRPVANVTIHLVDERHEPVPIGVRGELYAGGASVARCYWHDPVLTAQKVVPDPFSSAPGARLYRTGDLARYLANGEIEYLGRIDGQVKVRGFRVELGEVETTLARHPGVRDVAVVAVADPAGTRLAAYVVPEAGWSFRAEDLKQHLKGQLPEYMVPASWVEMAVLPVNANGKLDQAALPAPAPLVVETPYVAPRSAIEQVVADIWREILRLERVGAEDDFFAIGGHSLLATQVMSRLVAIFQTPLPLRRIFESPTVAGLAAALVAAESQPGRTAKLAGALVRVRSMREDEKRAVLAGGAEAVRG